MDLAEDLPSLESEVRECFVDDKVLHRKAECDS
jgi:hypothetical protein